MDFRFVVCCISFCWLCLFARWLVAVLFVCCVYLMVVGRFIGLFFCFFVVVFDFGGLLFAG